MLFLAPLLWSGNFVVARAVHEQIAPISLNFWRWVVALAFLLPMALPHLKPAYPVLRRHWRHVLVLALLGVAGFNSILYTALNWTTTTKAALLFSTTPLVIIAFSQLALREPLRGWQLVGLLLSAPGVALVITSGDLSLLLELQLNRGDLWVLVSVVVWAAYSVLLRRTLPGVAPIAMLTATAALGLVLLLPLHLWEVAKLGGVAWNGTTAASVLYLGVGAGAVAFLAWDRAITAVGPSIAGHFLHLIPMFGAGLAGALLGEAIAPAQVLGFAMILAGIYAANRAVRSATMAGRRAVRSLVRAAGGG
jgi:drug/metabolite transporter (DMT)-like permease